MHEINIYSIVVGSFEGEFMANGKGSARKPNPNKRSTQCHRNRKEANEARTRGEAKDADSKLARENPKEHKLRKNTSRPLGGW